MSDESTPTIPLAAILSDLVSLRVCVRPPPKPPIPSPQLTHTQDPAAALALVSARPHTSAQPSNLATQEEDTDLTRAKDLVKLHYDVKERHKRGDLSRGLEEARMRVARVG
jgi:hypothetical protein